MIEDLNVYYVVKDSGDVPTDCRNRLPLYLPYRIRYSSRSFSCIRRPQDNKPF